MNFLREKKVLYYTGLTRAVMYVHIAAKTFPQSFPLSGSAVAWKESDIQDWIEARINERDQHIKATLKDRA